ncbi:Lipoprotein-releasing system ATP-binding protein LolD [Actinomyces viscosus]|uniref:Lipoprotein-releasing system ATP-binding protein LolD n=2 Tax=Actinomyces viscosus TaxID=1656 RepID=A0A3S4VM21_ACTVI|nr:Lipoprotein-releasing system ATP-binding protein LolD [Actinomyces viscosus]
MSTTAHAACGTRTDAGVGVGAGVGLESRPQTARRPGEVIMRARGLEMSFGQTRALRGVDLDLLSGEVLAVTGPSGSGKSTLLHVMAGVLVPDAGSVSYYGAGASRGGATDPAEDTAADTTADVSVDASVDIAALDEAARSRLRLSEFGFVFQFGQLLPDLTALDNVTIPLLLAGAPRRRALARAREALGELGLSEHLDKRPGQLSGGQAQRAAVARALVTNPRLLFADEPTGSLDSLAAERTMEVLLESVRSRGAGLVIITHDARVAAYADREVTVRDGRIGAGAIQSARPAQRAPERPEERS